MNFQQSTPHPQRHFKNQVDIFGNDTILSPIVSASTSSKCTNTHLGANSKHPLVEKKQTKQKQIKEGAVSKAVLKELKITTGMPKLDNLTNSRNWYNWFPPLIVLDSDEEKTFCSQESLIKKDATKKKKNETVTKQDNSKELKPGSSKTTQSLRPNSKQPKKEEASSTSKPRTSKSKVPLNTLNEIKKPQRSKPEAFGNGKELIDPGTPSVVIIDEHESLFSPLISELSNVRECNEIKQCPILINANEKNLIKANKSSRPLAVINNIESNKINDHIWDKPLPKRSKVSTKTTAADSKSVEEQNLQTNEPDVSFFRDLVFKKNTSSGGVISKAMKTPCADLGFVEVEKGTVFRGQRSESVFLVLDGSVKACTSNWSRVLNPGDIIRFSFDTDIEYQLENQCKEKARLLYILEKV